MGAPRRCELRSCRRTHLRARRRCRVRRVVRFYGLSSLLLDDPLRDLPEPEVEHAIGIVFAAISGGLA